MGQFETLTDSERQELLELWIEAGHEQGLYIVAHVGSNSVARSRALAMHARSAGADAIGAVPPFYDYGPPNTPQAVNGLVDFLKEISDAAPDLPFFYYHIVRAVFPNNLTAVLDRANATFPNLIGVKWVVMDHYDWFHAVSKYNDSHALLYAPEPKLSSFSLGPGRGVVLAEDFFAQTYLRMQRHYFNGQPAKARAEQMWKARVSAVFSSYGGMTAERMVYQRLAGVDLGPPRRPRHAFCMDEEAMLKELSALGFFNDTSGV